MIEGLRLDVTADEIVKLIDQRITEHTENAAPTKPMRGNSR